MESLLFWGFVLLVLYFFGKYFMRGVNGSVDRAALGNAEKQVRSYEQDIKKLQIKLNKLASENNKNKSAVDGLKKQLESKTFVEKISNQRKKQIEQLEKKNQTLQISGEVIEAIKSAKLKTLFNAYSRLAIKDITSKLNTGNYSVIAERLRNLDTKIRDHEILTSSLTINFNVDINKLIDETKVKFEKLCQAEEERAIQAEIKTQMREEAQREKEIQQALKEAERNEQALIKARSKIEKEMKAANDDMRADFESQLIELNQKLEEAESNKRTISQAQLTRTGHIYVISNIGSFGENVYKVGMTRRLEPMDRVKELGDASVPFEFDVHAMFSCDDAPALEKALHRELNDYRVNKVNNRKEFFGIDLETIIEAVKSNHGEVDYIADAKALEYRDSINIEQAA